MSVCLTVVLAAAGLAISTGAASAARPTPAGPDVALPGAAVTQRAGTVNTFPGVTVTNYTTGAPFSYPGAPGDDVDLIFRGLTDNTNTIVSSATGLFATFCGNQDTSGTPRPLLAADLADPTSLAARCTNPGAPLGTNPSHLTVTYNGVPGEITVSGTLDSLPAGNACVAGQVLPCVVVLGNLTQSVVMILPVVHATAAAVAGPAPLVVSGVCNPAANPSTGCPSGRVSNPAALPPVINPLVAVGKGFFPNPNTYVPASPAPGQEGTFVTGDVCTSDAATCSSGEVIPTTPNPFGLIGQVTTTSGVGILQAQFLLAPTVATGNHLLRLRANHFVVVLGSPACAVGDIDISGGLGLCAHITVPQVQYAEIKVLGTPQVTLSVSSGIPGTHTQVLGHDLEPNQPVKMFMLDQNNQPFPLDADQNPQLTVTDGTGDIVQGAGTDFVPNFPAASVKTVVGGAPDTTVEPLFTKVNPFSNSADTITYCNDTANSGACAVGIQLDQNVLPGTLQEMVTDGFFGDDGGGQSGDSTITLNDLDLSTILLNDPSTWYPLSDPTTLPRVTVGDFRGTNTGWVVTAQSSDLVGATSNALPVPPGPGSQASNIIPAFDIWASNAQCDVSTIDGTADMSAQGDFVGLGTPAPGPDDTPDQTASSLLSDGSQDICDLGPDVNGRAAGIYDLGFDIQVAGRPTTAVDEYAGLITVTVTGN